MNVTLYCSFRPQSRAKYSSNMSTTKIGYPRNLWTNIEHGLYCPPSNGSSPHWFQHDDSCLRIDICKQVKGQISPATCCSGHIALAPTSLLASMMNQSTLTIQLHEESRYAKFLDVFKKEYTYSFALFMALNMYVVMDALSLNESIEFNGTIYKYNRLYLVFLTEFDFLWQLEDLPINVALIPDLPDKQFVPYKDKHGQYALCEVPALPPTSVGTCPHPSYFKCSDGTCLDEPLVCDGKQHCIGGEDEDECQDICTHPAKCLHCS